MNKQVFYDPQRKRWKRLRRVFDLTALFGALLGVFFIVGLVRMKPMHGLSLASATRRYRALSNPPAPELNPKEKLNHSAHRRTDLKPSDVVLNQGEGLPGVAARAGARWFHHRLYRRQHPVSGR
jgi:hypothetical protein